MLELEPTGQSGRTATGSAETGGAHIVLLPSGRHVVVTIFTLFLILFVCRQQAHAGSKTLHQRNPPVLNGKCRLT